MKNNFTNLLKGGTVLGVMLMVLSMTSVMAQEEEEEEADDFTFNVTLNSDQFFGFYPVFQGGYSISEKTDFTFYGILWSGGTGAAWGNWTEFGVGLNFKVAEGVAVNPQIGILGGNLLSSGTAGSGRLGDGIVPNLTVNLNKTKTEGQIYAGLYAPLRNEAPATATGTTLSYLHYWVNYGYKVSPFFSLGGHYEHLINTGGSNVETSTDVYQWLGPYIQFTKPTGGPFARFSFGTDLVEGNDSFFKLTTGFSF
jgi:hypothetical protein